ncbi:hypothetical protein ETI06_00255 [Macrococcoides goetzii]|nr:hypothetical protein [Macrococcus goetzii]TDM50442.1 hypothetical protein ETI06_00255 [Macrococcus goetzii]
MIPKYTTTEIVAKIQSQSLDSSHPALNLTADKVWSLREYQLASDAIHIDIEELMSFLPEEDLNNISFRALENNENIQEKVREVNQIFELLTYQLKIGEAND